MVSPEEPAESVQLVLEPNNNPAAKTYQQEICSARDTCGKFLCSVTIQKESRQGLKQHGVTFTKEPTKTTGSTIAILNDTCGNLIQITHLDW